MDDLINSDHYIPLMRLGSCLFVSSPASMSDSQARALQDAISARLSSEKGLSGLVMDVSSLAIVDSFAAKVLGDTANIAQSFGVRPVLVGMRPAVAMTLVELGVELPRVETALNLEGALRKLNLRIVSNAS